MPTSEMVGLDLMVEKVWKMSIEDDSVGIVGLYGMGGVGKTTLMKRIHNEFGKRKNDFDIVLWTVVSRDCDISKIMNNIRNGLGIDDDLWNKSSQDQRATMIYQGLNEKKFVLMLDDLWGKLELEMGGIPIPKKETNKKKSKVIFTTRYDDVCAKMQAQKKFKVECLLEKEAFDSFSKKVGDETLKCHGEIPKLAREITQKCGELPLALITVGTAMAGVKSVKAWRLEDVADGWRDQVKMHDVIRDMALWLARDQNENEDKIVVQEEALALSEINNSQRLNVVDRISVIMSSKEILLISVLPVFFKLLALSWRTQININKEVTTSLLNTRKSYSFGSDRKPQGSKGV